MSRTYHVPRTAHVLIWTLTITGRYIFYAHLGGEQTEVQTGYTACLRSHSPSVNSNLISETVELFLLGGVGFYHPRGASWEVLAASLEKDKEEKEAPPSQGDMSCHEENVWGCFWSQGILGVPPHCLRGQPVWGHLGHLHQEPGCRWGVVCWQPVLCVCVSVCL